MSSGTRRQPSTPNASSQRLFGGGNAARRRASSGRRASRQHRGIRGDYRAGKLDADDWSTFRDELADELDAATAQRERLAQQLADIERDQETADAEEQVYELLANIRRSIAGEVKTAVGVEAVRVALTRLFSGFVLHPRRNPRYDGRGRAELVDAGTDLMIELQVREQALVGYTESGMYPVLRQEPLHHNNQRDGLPIRYASGPS